jgi:quercetin dioxygenase-like cupin family protein
MHKSLIFLAATLLSVASTAALSQDTGVSTPEMSVQGRSETEPRIMPDGRVVHRYSAATVGLVYVEWPEGATTTAHNHANELVLTVVSGRLLAMSGDQEFIMEAGDVVTIPAWVDHSYVALEDSITYEAAGPG